MSAFLGPIHYWLYNKIQLQEELIREIVSFGEKSSWKVFSDKKLAEETVNKELRPLNELIDVMNIHGWLQERIQDAESRYALLVTNILKEDEKHLPALESTHAKAISLETIIHSRHRPPHDAHRMPWANSLV